MTNKRRALEDRIRILEEENLQLAERASDTMLLGLISDTVHDSGGKAAVFDTVLEQIAVLKNIPYAACGELEEGTFKPLSTYAAFTNEPAVGHPLILQPKLLLDIESGPCAGALEERLSCTFKPEEFTPVAFAVFPFQTRQIAHGLFIFLNNSGDPQYFHNIIPLLNQVVALAVGRYEKLQLLDALTQANNALEERIKERTAKLTRANEALEHEMAERRRSQDALEESRAILLTVLNSLDAKLYVVDPESYKILYSNKQLSAGETDHSDKNFCYEELYGLSEPCPDCSTDHLMDEDGNPAGLVVYPEEDVHAGKWYLNHDRLIYWTDGRLAKLRVVTDISEYKKLESQLQQSQKLEAIGCLAGGIAHDFNNLLMGIKGRADILNEDLSDVVSDQAEHIQAIQQHVASAAALTKQLLGFARGGKYEVKSVDLNALIQETALLFGRTHKEICIHDQLSDASPVISADKNQLEQVLLNIYINAMHAMPSGGDLYLETDTLELEGDRPAQQDLQPGMYVKISIRDTGTGMNKSTLEHIFEPFFTTKETGCGTGMGLASAYGIIRHHGGIISASSEPGKGSTFEILLPQSTESAPKEHPDKSPEPVKGTESVLVIDDQELVLTIATALLERMGYKVCTAKTDSEALNQVKADAPLDLVIMDLVMPGVDSVELYHEMKKLRPDLLVLISSGYAKEERAEAILEAGGNGFIQKPYSMSELSSKIQELLQSRVSCS